MLMFQLSAPVRTTGAFNQNISNLFSELKLVTDNLLFIYVTMQEPTEKPLKVYCVSSLKLVTTNDCLTFEV